MNPYLDFIQQKLKENFDVKYRTIVMKTGKATLIFIDNLCDSKFISEYIVAPLTISDIEVEKIEDVETKILYSNMLGHIKSREDALFHILSGDIVIVFDFIYDVIFCEAKGFSRRSITVPQTEAVLKGPREGFNEVIVDNVALIRRRIKNPNLKFESLTLGEKSNTAVLVSYIDGLAPKKLVDYIKNTIMNSRYDFILDVKYIEELFQSSNSPFDTVGSSEKPDVISSKIMEGRVAILVDGTPFVLSLPHFFVENFQYGDDYYLNKWYANASRWLRFLAYFIATYLPGIYVAVVTYHFSLIPSIFVFRLSVSRAGVPFPTVVEVILMLTFFQIIKEAGVRLPQPVGQAISIVGALILGDAALGAGLTSQTTVFIVALASICFFLIPKVYTGTAMWTVILVIFGALCGLPALYIGFFMLLSHTASLTSCGYPYLFPLGTLNIFKYKDAVNRKNLNSISNTLFDKDGET